MSPVTSMKSSEMISWNSHLSVYLTEVFIHSLVTALAVEALIYSWHIKKPVSLTRFRHLALILPLVLPPMYKIIDPSRAEGFFRENVAIFNGAPWLRLNLMEGFTLGHASIIIMCITSFLFVMQEVAPALSGGMGRHRAKRKLSPGEHPALEEALKSLTGNLIKPGEGKLEVYILEDKLPILCTGGLKNPCLMVSDSLLQLLDAEELKGALAHEISHIINDDRWKAWILLLLRAAMFYNPVALVVFRSIINGKEKVCDDLAVRITGNPLAFASGLIKVYKANLTIQSRGAARPAGGWLHSMVSGIENRSHRIRMEQRVKGLLQEGKPDDILHEEFRLGLLTGALAVLLFFVV